jgi:hypothetical protein
MRTINRHTGIKIQLTSTDAKSSARADPQTKKKAIYTKVSSPEVFCNVDVKAGWPDLGLVPSGLQPPSTLKDLRVDFDLPS